MLFRELDVKSTKESAAKVLGMYRRLRQVANSQYQPKITATYSFEPKSYTGGIVSSPIEKHIVRQITAQQKLKEIEDGINGVLASRQRAILIGKFVSSRFETDIALYMDMGLSESDFYREYDKALLAFAETYQHGRLLVFDGGRGIEDVLNDL